VPPGGTPRGNSPGRGSVEEALGSKPLECKVIGAFSDMECLI